MSEKVGIMICRDADQSQKPGAVKGHFCSICKKEVWITRDGMQHVETLHVLCNGCGFAMYAKLKASSAEVAEVFSPTAIQTAVEMMMHEKAGRN